MEKSVYERMATLEDHHWWFRGRRAITAALLDNLQLPANAALLEVGSGTGANLEVLSRFGQLSLLEPSDVARQLCTAKHGITPDDGALPDAVPYPAESFDLIAALDVLEHIEDHTAALQALRGLLKPGGRLLITVPAFPFLWSEHDNSHHHQRRYRRHGLTQLLRGAGFELSYISHYNTLLFPLIAAVRGVKALLPGKRIPDDSLPNPTLNQWLYRLFLLERPLIAAQRRLPFGVSLLAVATKGH